jgi:hypothetical protein
VKVIKPEAGAVMVSSVEPWYAMVTDELAAKAQVGAMVVETGAVALTVSVAVLEHVVATPPTGGDVEPPAAPAASDEASSSPVTPKTTVTAQTTRLSVELTPAMQFLSDLECSQAPSAPGSS